MAETIVDKPTCKNCGADVRENTQFCYNCGKSIDGSAETEPEENVPPTVQEVEANTKAALDDLAAKFKVDEPPEEKKLARAAEERKRARVERRRPREYRWEPV